MRRGRRIDRFRVSWARRDAPSTSSAACDGRGGPTCSRARRVSLCAAVWRQRSAAHRVSRSVRSGRSLHRRAKHVRQHRPHHAPLVPAPCGLSAPARLRATQHATTSETAQAMRRANAPHRPSSCRVGHDGAQLLRHLPRLRRCAKAGEKRVRQRRREEAQPYSRERERAAKHGERAEIHA